MQQLQGIRGRPLPHLYLLICRIGCSITYKFHRKDKTMSLATPIFINNLTTIFLLALASFCLTMALTPVYTFFAYRYKLWKVPRTVAVTGEKAPVLAKLHAAKHRRNI